MTEEIKKDAANKAKEVVDQAINQNIEQVKHTLDDHLKDMGLTKQNHNSLKSAVNRLFGESRVDKDRNDYLIIGKFAVHADEHLRAKKQKNSGKFKTYMELYFPRMQSSEISHSMWYFRNQEVVNDWLEAYDYITASSPGRIRRVISTWLKENEAEKSEYEAFGIKMPKPKPSKSADGKNTSDANSVESGVEIKDQEGNVIRSRPFNKLTAAELVDWLHAGMMELMDRGESKKKAIEFDQELLIKLEKISSGIADGQVNIEEKLKKAGLKTVETSRAA